MAATDATCRQYIWVIVYTKMIIKMNILPVFFIAFDPGNIFMFCSVKWFYFCAKRNSQ